ncbi:MAG: MotE family protein [Proteobacteria bacterium]|nr:MotE family protein [Pseudomonadota bacterium]
MRSLIACKLFSCRGVAWLAGGLLVFSSAMPVVAESIHNPMVGPPVDRSKHAFDLRQEQKQTPPIAYSFRIAVDDTKPEAAHKPEASDADALPLPPTTQQQLSPAQQYCSNILDATSAAQIAQQTHSLQKAQKEINDRIALLNAKADVLKSWMKLREDFAAHATDALVQIYSRMKPDSAAAQLAAMDEMTSAAIISKLAPKVSSPIMAEMEVAKAARLSAVIAGAGELAIQSERKANAQQ